MTKVFQKWLQYTCIIYENKGISKTNHMGKFYFSSANIFGDIAVLIF